MSLLSVRAASGPIHRMTGAAFLLATLLTSWIVPQEALLGLTRLPRFVAASALAFAPIFLANIIFAQRFRDISDSAGAFGANLLGAMVGGVLEYTSLIFGYRWLLILVALLYSLAFVASRASRQTGVQFSERMSVGQPARAR